MEVISNSVEDKLIDGLSYKLEPTASYITDRKSCTFWATGSNIYAPNAGTKVIKLVVNGDGWLDPSTVKVQFDVKNLEAQPLRTISGPWSMFRRMRVLCQGQLLEDIDMYNKVHQMFDVLQSKHVRENEDVEGFGIRYDSDYAKPMIEMPIEQVPVDLGPVMGVKFFESRSFAKHFWSVPASESKTVSFTPLAGVLAQGKLLPLRYCPLTIELEVVNDLADCIVSSDVGLGLKPDEGYGLSTKWQIENPVVKCDVCRMDNQLENEFAQRFLSGQSIPINFSTYVVQQQALSGQSPSLNITRALSRLKSVFLTLTGNGPVPTDIEATGKHEGAILKPFNDFYHPMAWANNYTANNEFEVQLQVGSKKFPEYPLRNQSDTYSALRRCLGIQSSTFHSIDIDPWEYRNHKFIVGIDCEKVLQASFSGENLKAGSLLTIMMKNESSNSAIYPTGATVVLHCDCILNLRDSGVELLD